MNKNQDFLYQIKNYIIKVHDKAVSINNDPKELRQGHDLYFIVYRSFQKSKESNIDFVLYLMKLIIEEHPFIEGNKRTAYIVGKSLLFFLGDKLLCMNKERAEKFVKLIAIRCEKDNPKKLIEIKKFVIESSKDFPSNLLDNKEELNAFLKTQPKVRTETIIKYLKKLSLEINKDDKTKKSS